MELTSKQRKILEKAAHDLQPVVIVGGAGVTEGVIKMVDDSLASHELLKVKFNEYKDEKVELTREICEQTNSTLVRVIGNVAILYREAEKKEDRQFDL
ncbi:MAG: ribosome assembly RNA-binding protein YhbY [Treponema sp.]|nr:ribosome assembly RNA-binding protein YhbY [Spirochaetia bacterium]MDY2839076.1 ribosome assembly RNA-binding protein YhbY [Treponema sp.]MDY5123483.1 ribosome assembly RNA-binding protein YhbY [Treponema sp.]